MYKSTLLPTQSNYFYSLFQPDYNCFVWQSIDNFVEMRPTQIKTEQDGKVEEGKIELEVVDYESRDNKAREMIDDTVTTPLKENWEVSKD